MRLMTLSFLLTSTRAALHGRAAPVGTSVIGRSLSKTHAAKAVGATPFAIGRVGRVRDPSMCAAVEEAKETVKVASMDEIVNLCKRRGFAFLSSEVKQQKFHEP
eukprot:3428403-Pleurochrysis_carterae.AAC.3